MVVAYALGLPLEDTAEALSKFAGVRRRFDLVDEVAGITIVDDYAHHPTEIKATIDAARELDYQRVVVCFQPHRYSRVKLFTEVLREDFSHAFDSADELIFMDVYSAGETPLPGVSGKTFLDVVTHEASSPHATYIPKRVETVARIAQMLKPGDLFITMGAGDVTSIGPQLAHVLQEGKHGAQD